MSTEHSNAVHGNGNLPVNKDVSFESHDINVRHILVYLLALAVAVAATFGVTVYILRFAESVAVESDRVLPPSHNGVGATIPPPPLLQGTPISPNDPQEDRREKVAADTKANETLDWVDRSAGVAQIPVEDAMKIIVSKGLSGASAAPEKSK
jgi:hypothetical protein